MKRRKFPTTPRQIAMAERIDRAWELRLQGWTLPAIAEELGISRVQVMRYLNKRLVALMGTSDRAASRYRHQISAQLEEVLAAWQDKALAATDDKAALVYLKALEQLAKLYGLYPKDGNPVGSTSPVIQVTYDNRQITIGQPAADALPQSTVSVVRLPSSADPADPDGDTEVTD